MKPMRAYLLLVGLAVCTPAYASDDAGTESPFGFGAGARDLALGGSAIALSDFATAPFWNPSRLSRAEQYSVAGFHSQLYESDVAYQYLGAVVPTLDFGTLGIGVFRLGIDGIEKRDAANAYLGDFDDTRLGFFVAYGRMLSGYDVGATLSMEHHSIDLYSATTSPGVSLALGRRFESPLAWLNHVSAVISARNVVRPAMDLAEVTTRYPFTIDVGVAAALRPGSFWDHELTVSATLSKVDRVEAAFALGIEYSLADLLHLRSGVRDSRLSFGIGLTYRLIRFDYALVDRDMGELHMFTLTSSFGRTMTERRNDRRERREAEFNSLMNERLVGRNREAVIVLVEQGRVALESGMLEDAVDLLDRARFMAVTSQVDTTDIIRFATEAREKLDESRRVMRYSQYLDSAQMELAAMDYLAARYFAGRALTEVPASEQAQSLLQQANDAISQSAAQDELIRQRLWTVDSLLSYGQVDQAVAVVRLLDEYSDSHEAVRRAQRRVEFERFRATATSAFGRGEYTIALNALESAIELFPGHQWCLDLKSRIDREMRRAGERPATPTVPAAAAPLSAEILREVEDAYRSAQQAFQQGDLESAIAQWETVDRLAPGYQSVRDYLVNAYKFVGVERYGKNQLREAVAIWRKAAALAPDNKEIAGYIERTENEIRKLEELSYDD